MIRTNTKRYLLLGMLLGLLLASSARPLRWVDADIGLLHEMYFAQLADGGGYATRFLLVNPGGTDIVCTLDLFRSNGTPLPLALNGTTDSSFTLNIKARGTLILKSGNQSDTTEIGWARVRSPSPMGGSLIYSYTVEGKVSGEAGLDPSVPANSFRLSVDMTNDHLVGLAIANPNEAATALNLTLYDTDGNTLASVNRELGGMQHFAQLPAEIFPDRSFFNFKGSIAVQTAERVVAGTTLRFNSRLNLLASIPVIDPNVQTDPTHLYFPQIADGGGYKTVFTLINLHTTAITVNLEMFEQDGTPFHSYMMPIGKDAASHTLSIPAHGCTSVWTVNSSTYTRSGWARVTADGPVGGSVIYDYYRGGKRDSQAGINPSSEVSEFLLAMDLRDDMMSGLAVANPAGAGSVTLSMTLLDREGRRIGSTVTRDLPSLHQFALLPDQLFPGVNLEDFTGSLVAKAVGGKVIGTTLRFNNDVSILASIPIISGISIAELPSTTTTTTSTPSTSTSSTLPPLTLSGSLDSPKTGATVSGVGSGSGWAVMIAGKTGLLPAKIELLVDGSAAAVARQGIARPDVKSYFSGLGITVPTDSGYTFSWASFVYPAGAHTLTIQATSSGGQKYELTRVTVHLPASNNNLHSTDSIVGRLRSIPSGTFQQGSPATEPGWETARERPVFMHTLTKDLLVMETEITRQMWMNLRTVQLTLPVDPSVVQYASSMNHPVNWVDWHQAVLFANLLSQQQGLTRVYYRDSAFTRPVDATNYGGDPICCNYEANGYRLPTEGEWEYFARAGTSGPFYISEPAYNQSTSQTCSAGTLKELEKNAWFCLFGGNTSQIVGLKTSNPWGLKDVHGNMGEWCWDWYTNYDSSPKMDHRGSSTGTERMIRGGHYATFSALIRSASRFAIPPQSRSLSIGFRLVRSLH